MADINLFEKDRRVIISKNLSVTKDHYGLNTEMEQMRGGEFKIEYLIDSVQIKIRSPYSGSVWSFHENDVRLAKPIEEKIFKPILFNPINLYEE